MLARDVAVSGFEPRHWAGWVDLLVPPPLRDHPRWALVVVDGSPAHVVKLVIGGDRARGALDPAGPAAHALALPPTPAALEAAARRWGVGAVVVVEAHALAAIAADVERHLTIDLDLAAQGLAVLRAVKARSGKGVWSHPPLLDLVPAPAYEPLQRTFELLVPDDSAVSAYVIADDRRSIVAAATVVKRRGDVAELHGHQPLADLVPEAALARDWPTSMKRLNQAIGERLARPSITVVLERATIDRIITGPADTFTREYGARRIVIDPAPAWLLGLIGGATVAGFAQRGASALASLLPTAARERAAGLAERARTAMKDAGAHPFALLGFDPIELWLALRHYYRPRPARPPA
ncbi:MAG TPA: hypothetical protein VHE35_27155 [Kofleriaceae bacterium]|nr:hypothetical protein [Kofleriaceae bacterium]